MCTTESCGLPLRGGVKLTNGYVGTDPAAWCSAGFVGSWWSGTTTYFFLMSAGHCVEPPGPAGWRSFDPDYGSSYNVGARGSYRYGSHAGNPGYLPTFDAAIISMDYAYHWTNIIAKPGQIWMKGWPNGENWGISGQASGMQGQWGCRSGFASNFTCGAIQTTSFNKTYTDGVAVTNLILVPGACPVNGDSGGVFLDGGTALGITSARMSNPDGSCYGGAFAHVTDIAQWLGVSVWN